MPVAESRARPAEDVVFEVRDVSVTFDMEGGESRVLDGVDFDVYRGETLGVVGESGSGKSMFASSLLNAVVEPGQVGGEVTYYPEDGDPMTVTDMSESKLKADVRWSEMAFVVQSAQSAFNPTMTVRQHFLETFAAHGVEEAAGLRRADEICRDLYLNPDQVLPSYPHELSGGMKQRVLLALGVVLDPEVVVLDEPTAALDLLMQRAIVSLLSDIKEKYDLTLVFVTHDLNLISLIADRLAVMYAFEFAEVGPTERILTEPEHPYTRALLSAVPNVSAPIETMEAIPGSTPNPSDVPSGCRYHPRCPVADKRCTREDPPLDVFGSAHAAACHYPERSQREVPIPTGSDPVHDVGPKSGGDDAASEEDDRDE
ncbi:ABC transporter ATP-binding protein [Halosimplex sp. J119]